MARDYASQGKKPRQVKSEGGVPGWVWALAGLSVGLCAAVVVYITQRPATTPGTEPVQEATAAATQDDPNIPPPTEPRFKFYDLLPRFEVKPNKEAYPVEPRPSTAPSSGPFIVQAGSFAKAEDAERRRASIALLGLESRVEKVNVRGQGVRYRVQIGPLADFDKARNAMRLLAENSIDSFASRAGG